MSVYARVFRNILSNRTVTFCATVLIGLALLSVFGPLFSSQSNFTTDFGNRLSPPTLTGGHVFRH